MIGHHCKNAVFYVSDWNNVDANKGLYMNGTLYQSIDSTTYSPITIYANNVELGVYKFFVADGDNTSNTLTVAFMGNWFNSHSMESMEVAGFVKGENYISNDGAGNYAMVTAYAKDMIFLNAKVASDKATLFSLVIGGDTVDSVGNTIDVCGSVDYATCTLQSETYFEVIPAGEWIRVWIESGNAGKKISALAYSKF